jgi:hypothetical protein
MQFRWKEGEMNFAFVVPEGMWGSEREQFIQARKASMLAMFHERRTAAQ